MKRELFLELAPIDDEIWVWAMAVLNDVKFKFPTDIMNGLIFNDIDLQEDGEVLWRENETKRDVWLARIIEHYPALLEKLICEAAEFKPYISVIMLINNPDNFSALINDIFWQRFPDFELILVNLGARVNFPPLPTNFHIINYPGGSLENALNLSLRKAAGEYIFFKGEDSILPINAIEFVAQTADNFNADVIHFAAHVEDGKFILDDALNFETETPKIFGGSKQSKALCWLENKLNRRLDTKIFRREFLTKQEINFDDGTEEFLFTALTQAEKYLLVPQAFCSIRK